MAAVLTIAEALRFGSAHLRNSRSPCLDTEVLLSATLAITRTQLYRDPDSVLAPRQASRYHALIEARAKGKPVAYLIGYTEFWSLRLEVDEHVLIPRPETELLVEFALIKHGPAAAFTVADIGTGSGAIAAAIASERPRATIVASELYMRAAATARHNVTRLGLDNINVICGDWLRPMAAERFDIIIANPPYVADGASPALDRDLGFEPPQALFAGADGLQSMARIAEQAPRALAVGGYLVLEHGCDQGLAVRTLLGQAGLNEVVTGRDLAGLERYTSGRRP